MRLEGCMRKPRITWHDKLKVFGVRIMERMSRQPRQDFTVACF